MILHLCWNIIGHSQAEDGLSGKRLDDGRSQGGKGLGAGRQRGDGSASERSMAPACTVEQFCHPLGCSFSIAGPLAEE